MLNEKNTPVTFRNGCAIDRDNFYLTLCPDEILEENDGDYSVMTFFMRNMEEKWSHHHLLDWDVTSTCFPDPIEGKARRIYALNVDGKVECYGQGEGTVEIIDEAGYMDGGPFYKIRKLGKHLYACSTGCQVYKREKTGWVRHDVGLRQENVQHAVKTAFQPPPKTEEEKDEMSLRMIEAMNDLIPLYDINGPAEDDLYVVGLDGFMAHYDDKEWERLRRITSAHLNCILVLSPSELWIAGDNGTILRGNAKDGFKAITRKTSKWDFLSITDYQGTIYISADDGIYAMNDEMPERLEISDQLDLRDVSHIEAKDGVLWALSPKKLVRFDGNQWECFIHPNNLSDELR